MKYYKRPKYKVDPKKISLRQDKDLESGEIYKEALRTKKRKVRR